MAKTYMAEKVEDPTAEEYLTALREYGTDLKENIRGALRSARDNTQFDEEEFLVALEGSVYHLILQAFSQGYSARTQPQSEIHRLIDGVEKEIRRVTQSLDANDAIKKLLDGLDPKE